MRTWILVWLVSSSTLLNAQTPAQKKHSLGIDLTYPIYAGIRYEQKAFEVIYRNYLSNRWFIHESAGFATRNDESPGNPFPQLTKLNGYFNRAGIHFQLYKSHWFNRSLYKRTTEEESGSIGINLLTGVQSYQLRYNTYGQLLLPYQVNDKGKLAYAGMEVQLSSRLLRIENFQLNWTLRYGLLYTTKQYKDFEKISALPGTGINRDSKEYGEFIGVYALYRF